MSSRRMNARTVFIVGVVFTLLTAATAIWRWSKGESAEDLLVFFRWCLIVLVFGLYLELRRDRPPR